MALIVAVNLLLGSDGVEDCSSRQFLTLVKKWRCVRKQFPKMFAGLPKRHTFASSISESAGD